MRIAFFIAVFAAATTKAQNRFDVLIHEIMADPNPAVGLPAVEWIELRNHSTTAVNLQGWKLGDAGSLSGAFPSFTLSPDSFVIVCSAGSLSALSVFGPAIAVSSFPSLDNDGDVLWLRAANGKTMHAVAYQATWYRNDLKKEGGWTLEMMDARNPCEGGANWLASTATAGGTPGRANSVMRFNADTKSPSLLHAYPADSLNVMLVFDESLDSASAANAARYSMDRGVTVVSAYPVAPLFDRVRLRLNAPMPVSVVYNIRVAAISDCAGNGIGEADVRAGMPSTAARADCVVNEILFNPRPNGFDFVELYNSGNKVLDISKLHIANRSAGGSVASIRPLSGTPFLFFPGDYLAFTEDPVNLELHYLVKERRRVLQVLSMPSFPDDEGDVVVLNAQGEVIDEVPYRDDWHFKLIHDAEGVSLERLNPREASYDAHNWHSAASTAGYATPGYKNSQQAGSGNGNRMIQIAPTVFSPDNDGRDDFAVIRYELNEPGYVANVTVFSLAGIPVRRLVSNSILGISGSWNWDGLNDRGEEVLPGPYIVFTQIFNLNGKREVFKLTVVVARTM